MNLLRKIKISWRYGQALYLVSALVTVAAVMLVFVDPLSVDVCLIFKLLSIPVILYLFMTLQKKHAIYFYLNLGFSKREFYAIPVVVDFVVFVLLMIISRILVHVIG